MRVQSQAQGQPTYNAHATTAQTPAAADSTDSSAKATEATAKTRDLVKLSPEATLKYGQARLEEHVRTKLKEQFAAAGIDLDAAAGQDWSPDATAQRIFGFASGLLGAYRAQNPKLSESEVLTKFEGLMRGAVDTGYGQALEVLNGMGASDEILSTAQTTIDKVHSLFDGFFAELRSQLEPQPAAKAEGPKP
jgi:hypothetical protein